MLSRSMDICTHREVYDSERDIDIRNTLGKEWEIVRIPTKYIEKDPTVIPEAIERIG